MLLKFKADKVDDNKYICMFGLNYHGTSNVVATEYRCTKPTWCIHGYPHPCAPEESSRGLSEDSLCRCLPVGEPCD